MIRALTLALTLFAGPAPAAEITVFAAASTGPALGEVAQAWAEETGHAATIAPAGSSALARQIAQGAPADAVVSANVAWMDWLEERSLLAPGSRRVVMENSLVLAAHGRAEAAPVTLTAGYDIARHLGAGDRLAMALVDAVPAGIYGRQALVSLGQWQALAPRVAQADNVRAALALVALGEAPVGIVYATDAAAEPRVHVLGTFPEGSHDPILYPGAVTAEAAAPGAARDFLDYLASDAGRAILEAHGFGVPE